MIVEEEVDTKVACFYFLLAIFFILAVISIPIWPDWLFNFVYNGSVKVLLPLSGFLLARFLVWYIPFHLGVSFWILPNLFYMKNVFSPLVEFQLYHDLLSPFNLFLRVASIGITSLGSYMTYEYINERITIRKKNETVQEWVKLWIKKYSKTKYREYHYTAVTGFYILMILWIVYRQKWGKKVIKSKVL